MKAIILARVSTEEQKEAGNSLPAQQARLRNYIECDSNLELEKEFIFDESAYKEHRKEFGKIVEYISSFKKPAALCCDKVDRLSRDFLIGLPELEKLRRTGKAELHFPSDNLILHRNSPATDLFHYNIALSLAQYYSNSISDNVKRAFEQKRRNGEWTGKAPIGYINIKDEKDNNDIILDPERSHFIPMVFKLYASGNYSMDQITEKMKKEGLTNNRPPYKPLFKSQIDKMIKESFHYGEAYSPTYDLRYPHKYPTLISRELYNKAQEVREGWGKKRFKYNSMFFMFKGLIKCADCGCTITAERKKNKYNYYHCTHGKGNCGNSNYIREEDLKAQVVDLLKQFNIPEIAQEEVNDDLRKSVENKNVYHKHSMDSLKKEYDKIENIIDMLYEDRADRRITTDEYDNKVKKYKQKQKDVLIQMEDHSEADEKFLLASSMAMRLADNAYKIFESSKENQKRQLLKFLLSNCQLVGRKLKFSLNMPFDSILECSKCSDWLRWLDSNQRPSR